MTAASGGRGHGPGGLAIEAAGLTKSYGRIQQAGGAGFSALRCVPAHSRGNRRPGCSPDS